MIADLKPYAEYKESGLPWLGRVPGHWDVRKLKQVSRRFWSGGTPQSGNDKYYCDAPHGYPWLMISDLTHQRRVRRTRKHITEAGLASRNLEMLPTGTVLFSMYASLGTAAVLEIDAAVNQAIIGISPRHTVISSDFALYSLEQLKTSLPSLASSSTQANLNAEKVRSLQISLPPPDEQAAIVRFLDWANGRLERAIRAKRKVIALLGEQKQAVIHRAVTRGLDPSVPLKPSGIPWLGDIPQHWEVRRVKNLARPGYKTFVDGDWIESPYIRDSGVRLIQTGNIGTGHYREKGFRYISEETFDAFGCTEILPGDVLICRLGEPVGRACLAPNLGVRMITSVDVCILKPSDAVSPAFAVYLMTAPGYLKWVGSLVRGSTRDRVSRSMLAGFTLPLPPIEEQAVIVAHLTDACGEVNGTISRLDREIELLREYRTRLVADVVTGKLDVREAATRLPDEASLDAVEDNADLGDEAETADEEAAV